jgi:hypothetical protein
LGDISCVVRKSAFPHNLASFLIELLLMQKRFELNPDRLLAVIGVNRWRIAERDVCPSPARTISNKRAWPSEWKFQSLLGQQTITKYQSYRMRLIVKHDISRRCDSEAHKITGEMTQRRFVQNVGPPCPMHGQCQQRFSWSLPCQPLIERGNRCGGQRSGKARATVVNRIAARRQRD